jgi:hypothetical protein
MFVKKLGRRIAISAALVMGLMGTAHAVPYAWYDDAGAFGTWISVGNPYGYQHDITDGANGYRPGIDSIYEAELTISLFDDHLLGIFPIGDSAETVGFRFDSTGGWTSSQDVDGSLLNWDDFDFIVTSLLTDGLLNVEIRANSGDFVFGGSALSAKGSLAVPEPATLSLFGLGLLALGFAARRRKA